MSHHLGDGNSQTEWHYPAMPHRAVRANRGSSNHELESPKSGWEGVDARGWWEAGVWGRMSECVAPLCRRERGVTTLLALVNIHEVSSLY